MNYFLFFMLLAIGGCAGLVVEPNGAVEQTPTPATSKVNASDFQTVESLHFLIYGRNPTLQNQISELSEKIYGKIMFDTNLLSFKPKENYKLYIYRDQNEYTQRTGYPRWSGGATQTLMVAQIQASDRDQVARTSIYSAEDMIVPSLLAHEMTHLVFNEFMEFNSIQDIDRVRWLNEGLATYEELNWMDTGEGNDYKNVTQSILKSKSLSLDELFKFKPIDETPVPLGSYFFNQRMRSYTSIDLWYWEVRSLTAFLIEKHGQYSFYQLMSALKNRKDLLSAMQDAYPGQWRTFQDLETEWKGSL